LSKALLFDTLRGMANETLATKNSGPTNRLPFGDKLKWLRDVKVFPDADFALCRISRAMTK
jgi:hypothetical protein